MNADHQIPLYLFAKAPVPGKVKTRMQPRLSQTKSAKLAALMLTRSVEKAREFWPGKVVLTVSPDGDHPVFKNLGLLYELDIELQIEGDLGKRLLHVFQTGIERYGCAAVMGSDVPHISGEILTTTCQLLRDGKNVIGPASDGGFYLLGLNRIDHDVFDGVDWGGDKVLFQVSENFRRQSVDLSQSPVLRDIDCWEDLIWLGTQEEEYQRFIS